MKQLFLSLYVVNISYDTSQPTYVRVGVEPRPSASRVPSVVSRLLVTLVTREVAATLGHFVEEPNGNCRSGTQCER
jgi:hypothetical protein